MKERIKIIAMSVVGLAIAAAWLWGIFLYLRDGNIAGAVGAFVVIPVGFLHGIGVL